MGNPNKLQRIIISVGGSMVVPNEGISTDFLNKLNHFIRKQLENNPQQQFFLVIGGGTTARTYRDGGYDVLGHDLTDEDLDWLGVHATRLNAHLVRTIFQDIAYPRIITDYNVIQKTKAPVVVAAGWKPGWSTDYCATLLCEDYNIKTIINLSNVKQVYDKDPNKFKDAKPKRKMLWKEFRAMIGDKWVPGMHAPFDPVAAKKADELGVKVVVMSGDDFENINKYFTGKEFVGTILKKVDSN
jgi:uridylate kinase